MHLAKSYAHTGISPLSSGFLAPGATPLELSFTIHPLADCFPVGALQNLRGDLFTGAPLLAPSSIGSNASAVSRHSETGIRTVRSPWTPLIWEDVTMSFASKVLDLSCLPQGSRCHYE